METLWVPVAGSFGKGVDSVAYILRRMREREEHGFDVQREREVYGFDIERDLVLVTAMTGNEHPRTGEYMQRYMLPLFAKHGIRYVQLARAGQLKRHGYVVLSDSRQTERMVMEGPWRLDHEMRSVGTVPSVRSGRRWCSIRAKGDPIDWWVADNCRPGYRHVMGFAYDEQWRAERDRKIRKEKFQEGKAIESLPLYPLIEWEMDRVDCQQYIEEVLHVKWPRSCCTYCPFQETAGTREELAERWRTQPEAGADGVELEYTSLALNPRIGLFGVDSTARNFAIKHDLEDVIRIADRRIADAAEWLVIDVRRVFDAKDGDKHLKGQAWRSNRVVARGPRSEMLAAVRGWDGAELITDERGYTRAWREQLPPKTDITYPATEWFRVAVPTGVRNKQRPGFPKVWTRAHTETLL